MANTVLLCPIYKANEKLKKLNFTYNSFAKSIIKNSKSKIDTNRRSVSANKIY